MENADNKNKCNNCEDEAMIRSHIATLALLETSIRNFEKKQDEALANQRAIFKRLGAVETAVVKLETEKKTTTSLVGLISGALGTLGALFFKGGGTH